MNTIPADDSRRSLAITKADDPTQPHIGLAGDTYTILLTGKDTAGRYCLIDMHNSSRRWSAPAPPRFRGVIYCTGRRDRGDVSR